MEHFGAVELNPEFAMAHNNLAVAYLHKGDMAQAKQQIDQAWHWGIPCIRAAKSINQE